MRATVKMVILAAVALSLLIVADARAQCIAFFRHDPGEDLGNLRVSACSKVIGASQLERMSVSDLLAFDLLYIEGTGPGFAVALQRRDTIARAVELGLGLYVVGHDPAIFGVAPVDLSFSPALATGELRIPVAALWHPISSSSFLDALTRATSGPALRAFGALPAGYSALQEVHVGRGAYLPTLIAGRHGHGQVILRTTAWRYEGTQSAGSAVALAMARFASEGVTLEPVADEATAVAATLDY